MTNWVLLRGLGRDKRHWYKFTDQLREAYPNSKILPLDLPGIQSQSAVPTNIHAMVDEVRDNWLDEKTEGDWNLLAISLGGMLAIDWCYRYPNDFKHLVTINTSSKTTSSLFERISPSAIKAVGSSIATNDTRERERKVLEITTNETDITEEMLDTWVEIADSMKLSRLNLIKQLFAASKFKLPKKLQVPYTALASKGDRFCDYSCSEKIARRYNAPLFLHESAGHDLPTDDAKWVIEKLQNI
ncbi:MAG: alpha/beta hydrolase [Bdellovibrionota bacterium]|nr:alpha/beta hydrolase [Bdellovibrionota bacterium]